MANLQLSMTMATRPCIITIYPRRIRGDILLPTETRKAVFHCWFSEQTVAAPSALRGGHPGGRVSCLLGLVEYEDGTMHLHDPREIRFIDSEEHFDSITWDEAEGDEGGGNVRHINGNKTDNWPENLKIYASQTEHI